jgi:conjugative relaxase-like TrwC/TraI family protein
MSVHRMSAAGGFRYLLRHTASADVDRGQLPLVDYYAASGNPPGRWLGTGLAGLVDGQGVPVGTQVSEAAMTAVFGHATDPVTGAALGRPFPTRTGTDGVRRPSGVAGYDLTFTPVKSVSVLWALGDPGTRAAVEAAHHAAVTQTLGILEARVAATRIGSGGATRVPVRGVVAAAFDHPDTRQGDPNLHTHVVVANRVQAADGQWRTLDGQQLFAAGVALSETYDALVADEVARRLRVGFGWRDRGARRTPAFEVDGIDDQLLAVFSSRSRDITSHLHDLVTDFHSAHDRGPTRVETIRLRQTATLATRPVKSAHAWSDLLTAWAQRARAATGREPRDLLAAALDGSYARPLRARDIGRESRRDLAALAVVGVADRRSTWNAWNLEAEIVRLTKHLRMASPSDRAALHAAVLAVAVQECVPLDGVEPAALVRDAATAGRAAVTASVTRPVAAVTSAVSAESPTVVTVTSPNAAVTASVTSTVTDENEHARTGTTAVTTVGSPDTTRLGHEGDSSSMSRRYTSPAILAAETRLLYAATTGVGPALDPAHVDGVVAALTVDADRPLDEVLDRRVRVAGLARLSPDQAAAVAQVCTDGRAVQVLVGPAGTGKTTTLKVIARLWGRDPANAVDGPAVIGLAPSATAAARLSEALRIPCETTAKWLHETTGPAGQERAALLDDLATPGSVPLDHKERRGRATAWQRLNAEADRWRLHPGQLLIVDEASLAGTLDLDLLVTQARAAGAGVLLVGDQHQLSAVQAGGAFGLLARRTRAAELSGLWRFRHRWEAEATRRLRHGDPTALDTYAAHGRVHDGDHDAVVDAALAAWRADTDAGLESLLIAADTDTVRELNARIRLDNITTGRATATGVVLWDGTTAGVGDRITTRRNDRAQRLPDGGHVRNGETFTVVAVHHDGSLDAHPALDAGSGEALVNGLGRDASASIRLPSEYVAEHVELGYAITAHRAQSTTVDTAHVITGPGMAREHLYVAMTRGRDANHAYVPLDHHDDIDEAHHSDAPGHGPVTGREVLEQILATSGAEQSATEQLAPSPISRLPVSARRPQDRDRSLAPSRGPGRDGPGLTR